MIIRDMRDVIGGGLLVCTGIAAGAAAIGYGIGTPSQTEPGFFPLLLSGLLTLSGGGILWGGFDRSGTATPEPPLRPSLWHLWCLVVIASGFVLFGLLLPVAGLFLTCLVSITAVGAGSRLLSPLAALATSAVLAAIAVVLFRYLLDLQVPAWPWGG